PHSLNSTDRDENHRQCFDHQGEISRPMLDPNDENVSVSPVFAFAACLSWKREWLHAAFLFVLRRVRPVKVLTSDDTKTRDHRKPPGNFLGKRNSIARSNAYRQGLYFLLVASYRSITTTPPLAEASPGPM